METKDKEITNLVKRLILEDYFKNLNNAIY